MSTETNEKRSRESNVRTGLAESQRTIQTSVHRNAPDSTLPLTDTSDETNIRSNPEERHHAIQAPQTIHAIAAHSLEWRYGALVFRVRIGHRGSVTATVHKPSSAAVDAGGVSADWNVLREASGRGLGVFLPPRPLAPVRGGIALSEHCTAEFVRWLRSRPEYTGRFRPHYHRED